MAGQPEQASCSSLHQQLDFAPNNRGTRMRAGSLINKVKVKVAHLLLELHSVHLLLQHIVQVFFRYEVLQAILTQRIKYDLHPMKFFHFQIFYICPMLVTYWYLDIHLVAEFLHQCFRFHHQLLNMITCENRSNECNSHKANINTCMLLISERSALLLDKVATRSDISSAFFLKLFSSSKLDCSASCRY